MSSASAEAEPELPPSRRAFASLRFDGVVSAHAEQLRAAMQSRGADLQIVDVRGGGDIDRAVSEGILAAEYFVVFGSAKYGEDTGNSASTYYESKFAQNQKKKIILIRMIPFDEEFEFPRAKFLFGVNIMQLTWMLGAPMPTELPGQVLDAMGLGGGVGVAAPIAAAGSGEDPPPDEGGDSNDMSDNGNIRSSRAEARALVQPDAAAAMTDGGREAQPKWRVSLEILGLGLLATNATAEPSHHPPPPTDRSQHSHTVVTHTSRGERKQNACCGVCFGVFLFVGSFPLLWWNEGRSIKRYQSLEEGRKAVVVVPDPTAAVDHSREGALVYMSGKAAAAGDATLASDPTFGVAPPDVLKLRRVAKMYQWEESRSSHTTKTNDGGTKTTTTYSYHKTWSDHPISSGSFSDPTNHQNPSSMPYTSQEYATDPIAVGSYTLSNGLVDKINWWSDWRNDGSLSVDNIADDYWRQNAVVDGDGFYIGASPGSPEVGDETIRFRYIPEGTVSLVAAQTGETFSPYATRRGGHILLLRGGYHTADDLFLLAQRDNVTVTWLLRLAGFVVMYLGLKAVSKPLEVVLDRIPLVGRCAGDLMGGAMSLVTCLAAAVLSVLTIAIAWFAYRPLLTIALLAIVGGLVYVIMKKKVDDSKSSGKNMKKKVDDWKRGPGPPSRPPRRTSNEIPVVMDTSEYQDHGSYV